MLVTIKGSVRLDPRCQAESQPLPFLKLSEGELETAGQTESEPGFTGCVREQ